jgi:hypothetical protein
MSFDHIMLRPLAAASIVIVTSVSPNSPLMSDADGRIKFHDMGNREARAAAVHSHDMYSVQPLGQFEWCVLGFL